MRRLTALALAVLALAGIVWLMRGDRQTPEPSSDEPAQKSLHRSHDTTVSVIATLDASDQHPLPPILVDPSISITKSQRSLTVYSDGTAVKVYRIALGSEPTADKEREGDNRTPEGEFYVCTKNADSAYHRALGISYPNEEDAERGLHDGLISSREHRQLLDALAHYRQPSWRTALGGEIMIHGGGIATDWTQGCIAMDDAEAEELFDAIPLGARVVILP